MSEYVYQTTTQHQDKQLHSNSDTQQQINNRDDKKHNTLHDALQYGTTKKNSHNTQDINLHYKVNNSSWNISESRNSISQFDIKILSYTLQSK